MHFFIGLGLLAVAAETPTPLAFFAGDRDAISERIAAECVLSGRDVDRRDDREIVCSKPVGGIKGAWAKFGIGRSSFDEKSRQRVKFSLVARDGLIEARATRDIGPGRKAQVWDADSANAATGMMVRAGGRITAFIPAPPDGPQVRTTGPLIVPAEVR